MRDDRDYKLDLSTSPRRETESRADGRPFISVHFACCNVYCRVYRNLDAKRYDGRCPRCARTVSFIVGDGGTNQRFFVAQ